MLGGFLLACARTVGTPAAEMSAAEVDEGVRSTGAMGARREERKPKSEGRGEAGALTAVGRAKAGVAEREVVDAAARVEGAAVAPGAGAGDSAVIETAVAAGATGVLG